jgi:hypothetical protein
MEVFNSDHGSNILGSGNLCTAGSQIFKTKGFTWFSEVNFFQCGTRVETYRSYLKQAVMFKIVPLKN